MSTEILDSLSSNSHFIRLPLPIFEFLSRQNLTSAQLLVFMLHWRDAQMNRDWKSQLPRRTVATRLGISESTVKRSYVVLQKLGLIKRHDQGRSQHDPMRNEVTITEVTVPDDVRSAYEHAPKVARNHQASAMPDSDTTPQKYEKPETTETSKPKYIDLDEDSNTASTQDKISTMTHKPRGEKLNGFGKAISERGKKINKVRKKRNLVNNRARGGKSRQLTRGFAFKVRKAIKAHVAPERVNDVWQQVLWSLEEGHLTSKPVPHGFNLAMWLIQRNLWETPFGMPKVWRWQPM